MGKIKTTCKHDQGQKTMMFISTIFVKTNTVNHVYLYLSPHLKETVSHKENQKNVYLITV